jgi:hypothetical protein
LKTVAFDIKLIQPRAKVDIVRKPNPNNIVFFDPNAFLIIELKGAKTI